MSKAVQFKNKNGEKVYPCPYYPVGAIYLSVTNTNPESIFGGKWEQIKDRFLLACGNTYTNGSTGGSRTHSHKYGFQYGGYYSDVMLEGNGDAGLINYSQNNSISVTGGGDGIGGKTHNVNGNNVTSSKETNAAHYRMIAQNEYVSTLPPYLAIFVWKRVR